jgi:hypothetical protein
MKKSYNTNKNGVHKNHAIGRNSNIHEDHAMQKKNTCAYEITQPKIHPAHEYHAIQKIYAYENDTVQETVMHMKVAQYRKESSHESISLQADLEWISAENCHLVTASYQRLHDGLKHKLVAEGGTRKDT